MIQTAGEGSLHAILEVQAHVALLQQALSLAGSHKEGTADSLWPGGLEVEALAVSLAAAVFAAAERREDLLVHLRVGGRCCLSVLISREKRAMLGRACACEGEGGYTYS